jgi:hypothetical protein
MKILFLLLFLVSCSNEPKYAAKDCVIIEPNPFNRNIHTGVIFEIKNYVNITDLTYIACPTPYDFEIKCISFLEEQIKQTVTCPSKFD